MILWRNNKTGRLFIWLAVGVDCTSTREAEKVVIYRPQDDENTVCVRDAKEFTANFTAEHV